MYATSKNGTNFEKYFGAGTINYPWNGSKNTPVSPTNILEIGDAATGTGIIFDAQEPNSSRRYKAFGTFWNYKPCGPRPTNPVHGEI